LHAIFFIGKVYDLCLFIFKVLLFLYIFFIKVANKYNEYIGTALWETML